MGTPDNVSRRRFGRGVLLGGPALGVAAVVGTTDAAGAAPASTAWRLGGNPGLAADGSNFLGPTSVSPLIFKTSPTLGHPVERARFTSIGNFVIKGNTAIGTTPSAAARLVSTTGSASGTGVRGTSPNSISTALNAKGVQGIGTVGVQGTGEYMGVQGTSLNYAVFGFTNPDTGGIGVYGRGAQGVKGRSYTGFAVLGDTDSGTGVKGESYSDGGAVKAIHGQGFGNNNNGVVGEASNGTAAYGVWGISSAGYAGVFSGKALVTGTLSKGGGSFKIDHPLDPTNKYLYHSFVESPDMMNVYNGNVTTNAAGTATVTLPDYFMSLNRDFRYQLTVIGEFAQAIVSKEVHDGRFEIRTNQPKIKVSWQVTGIRKDPWAEANRIPVAERKPAHERGRFLHPEAYGKPESMSVMHEELSSLKRVAPRQPDPMPS